MPEFTGFSDHETFTSLPDTLFRRLLNEIDDLAELKVLLYALWRTAHMEGGFRCLSREDIHADQAFTAAISAADLGRALAQAVKRGGLIRVEAGGKEFYFINSPRGRAGADALRQGTWQPGEHAGAAPVSERPNIFKLYEENIGPLTPLIADALREAEQTHPPDWIEDAFAEAVKNNKRSWRYIEAILKRWKEEGRAKKQDRRNPQEDGHGRDVLREVEAFRRRK